LAPKIYALKNNLAELEIIKIKGLTKAAINNNNINLKLLKTLLTKDYHLIFNQRKWFRNLKDANIKILDQIYTLALLVVLLLQVDPILQDLKINYGII